MTTKRNQKRRALPLQTVKVGNDLDPKIAVINIVKEDDQETRRKNRKNVRMTNSVGQLSILLIQKK